jgi:hypothetical protein
MKKTFVETGEFTEWVKDYLSGDKKLYRQLVVFLKGQSR